VYCALISRWVSFSTDKIITFLRYLKYAGFGPAKAYDIQAYDPDNKFNDPMFIVEGTK
jgi:hypothetical protein